MVFVFTATWKASRVNRKKEDQLRKVIIMISSPLVVPETPAAGETNNFAPLTSARLIGRNYWTCDKKSISCLLEKDVLQGEKECASVESALSKLRDRDLGK